MLISLMIKKDKWIMGKAEFIENGSVTSVPGFLAAGVTAGFKKSGAPDFALVYSETPAAFSGVFTSCTFAAAPVLLGREKVLGVLLSFDDGLASGAGGESGESENGAKFSKIFHLIFSFLF